MTTNRIGKNNQANEATKVQQGLKLHFVNGAQVLPLAGGAKPTTVTDLTTALGLIVTLRAATVAARAALAAALAQEKAQLPALVDLLGATIAFVRATLGANPQALADFGLPPRKARTPLTAEQKAVAAAKRKATRQARGTKGAKAKAAIHGNVTAKLVVTPEAPAPAEAPAATAPAPAAAAAPAVTKPAG